MNGAGAVGPSGALGLRVIRGGALADREPVITWPSKTLTVHDVNEFGHPQKRLPAEVNEWRHANASKLARGVRRVLLARSLHIPTIYGQLFLTKITAKGDVLPLGLAGMRLVTTVGCKFIADDFNAGATDVSTMKFHGFGTGTTAEAVGDTALVTEETTQYVTDSTRPTGSQASATVSTNATYTTVATYSPDSGGTRAITEHGVFSVATVGSGTLLDRTVFSAVNLVASADSLQATYVFTIVSGG